MTFQVRACEDARLILADVPGQWSTFAKEIRIGIDNNVTAVFDQYMSFGEPLSSAQSDGILNCTEHRSLWLSWKEKRVDFGTGLDVGENRVLYFGRGDFVMLLSSIGFYSRPSTTSEEGVDSNWIIGYIPGSTPSTPTPKRRDRDMTGGEAIGVAAGIWSLIILIVVLAFFGWRHYRFLGITTKSNPGSVHFSNPNYQDPSTDKIADATVTVSEEGHAGGNEDS